MVLSQLQGEGGEFAIQLPIFSSEPLEDRLLLDCLRLILLHPKTRVVKAELEHLVLFLAFLQQDSQPLDLLGNKGQFFLILLIRFSDLVPFLFENDERVLHIDELYFVVALGYGKVGNKVLRFLKHLLLTTVVFLTR